MNVETRVLWARSETEAPPNVSLGKRLLISYPIYNLFPQIGKDKQMSRFRKLTHTIWHCQYHLVWVPKYRYRILVGPVKKEVVHSIQVFAAQQKGEIIELNVQKDHVHLICMVPAKVSISDFTGKLKGRSAIRILHRFPDIRQNRYWGNHFWAKGYCVDTIGVDAEVIRKYVKYQEERERREEQQNLKF